MSFELMLAAHSSSNVTSEPSPLLATASMNGLLAASPPTATAPHQVNHIDPFAIHMQVGNKTILSPFYIFGVAEMQSPIENIWNYNFCLERVISRMPHTGAPLALMNIHFCAKGYLFPVILVMSLVLFCISGYCFVMLVRKCPDSHSHRKVLFGLLLSASIVRSVYGAIATNKISRIETLEDALPVMKFMVNTLIPVNALSDFLTAMVDFLLTFFWLSVLGYKITKGSTSKIVHGATAVFFLIVGIVCFVIDNHQLENDKNEWNIYRYTLIYIAVLLFVSALLHSVTVVMLLSKLYKLHKLNAMSPKLRTHFVRVSIIGAISTVCWLFRGFILILRAAESSLSQDEMNSTQRNLSFSNEDFTLSYFVIFMNTPCIVVAVAFYLLSRELFHQTDEVKGAFDPRHQFDQSAIDEAVQAGCGGGNSALCSTTPLMIRPSTRHVERVPLMESANSRTSRNSRRSFPSTTAMPHSSNNRGEGVTEKGTEEETSPLTNSSEKTTTSSGCNNQGGTLNINNSCSVHGSSRSSNSEVAGAVAVSVHEDGGAVENGQGYGSV